MFTLKTGTLAILIPLALALPAHADQPMRGAMGFSQMDHDGDGAITLEEMQVGPAGMLARADTNGDGDLSRDELIAAATVRASEQIDRMLARADGNSDGILSAEEIAAMQDGRRADRMARMFERLDADDNGSLSAEELEQARGGMGRRGGEHGERRGGHGFWRG
ncbi:EF-hand domain-containing protein [Roseicyclus sp.]|uniref:EF-hand domain-containing protein n=1 Tax=Roseicyclus sp. TaxID=1914329 RepID=UPI003F6B9660